MDRIATKKTLSELLNAGEYHVIALTGAWGAGKTFLWRELASDSKLRHGYASLFGVGDKAEIKRRLASSVMRLHEQEGAQLRRSWKAIHAPLAKVVDRLSDGNGLVGAAATVVNDLAGERLIERLLQNTVLVLDDLERAEKGLTIEALLGVIDELRNLKSRVVLILNDEELCRRFSDRLEEWNGFKEKAIDISLALQTSTQDAFLAISPTIEPHLRGIVRDAWINTRCRNIRIGQRAARTVQTIFADTDPHAVATYFPKLIADTVYLTVAENRGFYRDADAEAILSASTQIFVKKDPDGKSRIESIRNATPVQFSIYRNFQTAAIRFLKTGQIERIVWDGLLDEVKRDIEEGSRLQRLNDWMRRALWNPVVSDADLRSEAEELIPECWRLDPKNAQVFVFALKEIGASDLSEHFISTWCDQIVSRKISYKITNYFPPIEALDPRILSAVDEVTNQLNPPPSLLEALRDRFTDRGYSQQGAIVIDATTVSEWIDFLVTTTSDEPFELAQQMIRDTGQDVKNGAASAVAALRQFCDTMPESRLARIVVKRGILNPQVITSEDD